MNNQKFSNSQLAALVIIAVLAIVVVYNTARIVSLPGTANVISNNVIANAIDVIPKGTPAVYGAELGVKYDDVSPADQRRADTTISILGNLDNKITLKGDDLNRYITVASKISCEYCCGAESIIFSNGQAACGCAHSYAMRGLAKYLITNHRDEYTDDQILEELGKWKVLFFPDVHATKAGVLDSQGIELNYINLASNKYRGAEKGSQASSGGMVGGC